LLYVSHLGNVGVHLSWALRHRRYDPGAVTAILTLMPVAVVGLRQLHQDPAVSRRSTAAGAIGGVVLSAALVPLLKRRVAHR
jgi:hypothetical protein